MPGLDSTIAELARQRRQWDAFLRSMPGVALPRREAPERSRLVEVKDFGSNPGELRMFEYVPADPQPSLVVVLHGCTQNAAVYDIGAGWSRLADRYGFHLLMPEQRPQNNPKTCFNWFRAEDATRGHGEVHSIVQMIEAMAVRHRIDRKNVFVTGLSAGGAMTAALLATYPEKFAAGAIVAGLPYGAATNMKQAFESMFRVRVKSAREWGDLVRAASPHRGPWPRVAVWHGGADSVVKPKNAEEILKQWTDVHGLGTTPTRTETVSGYPRRVWADRKGAPVIECWMIPLMPHGTPLATGTDDSYGVPGEFLIDVGISSSYHIVKFFGLADPRRARRARAAGAVEGAGFVMNPTNPTATLNGLGHPPHAAGETSTAPRAGTGEGGRSGGERRPSDAARPQPGRKGGVEGLVRRVLSATGLIRPC
ncbi:Poly(3-hydroxyalkanoate) depolymerase [Rhodovulum sp. PH10]|uniref:extracellular catalytic domain type 1 short-chain-length polyhydroxyalkanoate depolymerase n=1 Tax=Rhodovulum sp. PH10 TaxID=1187851 RepID=UPI00027C1F55|nr:PHB depolymerase family esterase [Rhodovulum sp. PH10]EJW09391.1 Poly(3-hydroxyalkanoate) depolymerase [Rhodovulum sp. PH10]